MRELPSGQHSAQALVDGLLPWLREEYRPSFDAALAWGWPRCRTEEERLLLPCLLVVLSPFAAVIAPRRLSGGHLVSFLISVGRPTPSGPERLRWRVVSARAPEADVGEAPEPPASEDLLLVQLAPGLVRQHPWPAACRVASAIGQALGRPAG